MKEYSEAELVIEVAGVSRGNPGMAGIGVIIGTPDHNVIERVAEFIGLATPLQAEYEALLWGLRAGLGRKPRQLRIKLGSEAVRRQVEGRTTAVLPETAELYTRCIELLRGETPVTLEAADTEELLLATELADLAVDSRGRRQAH